MGGQELAVKYSNDIYATPKDIKKDLGTNLIDGIWRQVNEYRRNFFKGLKLRHIDSTEYSICLTPRIADKVNAIERKLMRLSSAYKRISAVNAERIFSVDSKVEILKVIAKNYNLVAEDELLKMIASGTCYNVDPQYSILTRYNDCIDKIARFPLEQIDENTIGEFYSLILGTDELTEFYRTTEINNKLNKYLVNKTYLGIPPQLIDRNMEDLLNFVSYQECSVLVKAISAFYFIYYVKPFEVYSEEIAILMLKKILSCNDYEESTAFVNFEKILPNRDELDNVVFECQKTHDLTYLFWFLFDTIDSLIDQSLNTIELAERKTIRNDFYQKDSYEPNRVEETRSSFEENAFTNSEKTPLGESELDSIVPEETLFEQPKPIYEPQQTVEVAKEIVQPVVKEEPQIVVSEPVITETKIETKPVEQKEPELSVPDKTIAISVIPATLTEEEASKLENRLIEMNPLLSRGQAYFYARHCTIGMSYTIAQYKKEVGCAYETARNSMDGLVSLGYYSKKQLKNKYIYTPIKRN